MLKYEGQEYYLVNGVPVITKQGTPVDGAHVFRNKAAQRLFDELRKRDYIDDYGVSEGGIYFRFLNGADEWYKRRDFIKLAKRYEEDIEDWERP